MRDGKFRRNADANVKGITGASAAPDIRGTGTTRCGRQTAGTPRRKAMYACKGCPWSTRGCRRAERRTLPVHGWERCPLAADVAGTAGKSETKTTNTEKGR